MIYFKRISAMTVSKSFFSTIFTLAKFLLHNRQASERMTLKEKK